MNELTYEQRADIGFEYVRGLFNTASPYGAKAVRHLRFFKPEEREALERELHNVERVKNTLDAFADEYEMLDHMLSQLKDIRHSIRRCERGVLSEVELFEIKQFLLQLSLIVPMFDKINAATKLEGIEITDAASALEKLDMDGEKSVTFYIGEGLSPALAEVRRKKREMEGRIRAATGEERDALMRERALLAAREDEEETRIRALLSEELRPYAYELLSNTDAIAALDFTMARARLARAYHAVKPELCDAGVFILGMENPRVADALRKKGKAFTPVSVALEKGATVVTGANMGGKSVALKTLALTVLLIHAGIFPFAKAVKTQLFENVFLLFEDLENAEKGLSSFGAEIVRLNEILRECGENSLILLDEFARGTNPYEGAQIVRAVTRRFNAMPCVSLLTTHYDHVAEFANAHYQVMGLRGTQMEEIQREIAASAGDGVDVVAKHMNYGLFRAEKDNPCPRDALNVCRLLGLDEAVMAEIEKLY